MGSARRAVTRDDIDKLYSRAQSAADHRRAAEQLAAWAEETHPHDRDVSPAALLVSAGEHLTAAGDAEGAVVFFRRAVEAGQYVPPDVRCYLHGGLLQAEDVDAARELADELRRERPIDGDVYRFIGDNYEAAGDLRRAHRWLTMGAQRTLNEVADGDDVAAEDAPGVLMTRLRVRHALGLRLDDYDSLVASALLAERQSSG
ncbi:MAG: hypothetical protein M3Q22_07170 [Actinomycetota bacterium]|nr:hypothetical protein [Actinomycetota bacterium]